jgi:hypothetical protein
MSKLISLTLNNKFGILEAQKAEFVTNNAGLIEIRAGVGQGKTTAKEATEMAVSGGNKQVLNFDATKHKNVDVEVQITYGDTPIFMRTYTDKSGDLKSVAYIKDKDGKIARDPVINGKKLTPASLRETMRTDLTFGIDQFLSENTRTHMQFMMNIYAHKLKQFGVIFDKNSPDYQGSILYILEQAKMERQNKHIARRSIDGFKESLEKDGWDEENIPTFINISQIEQEKINKEKEHRKAFDEEQKNYYNKKEQLQAKINELSSKAKDYIAVCSSYNDNIESETELKRQKLRKEIEEFNKEQEKKKDTRLSALKYLCFLKDLGYRGSEVITWIETLPLEELDRSMSELEYLASPEKIPFMDGKLSKEAFDKSYSEKVDNALKEIIALRAKAGKYNTELVNLKEPVFEPVDLSSYDQKINNAKENNKVIERWNSFYDWKESDEKVKNIWKEYCSMFAKLDLGVEGLSMQVVGDEENSEIRTMYNGISNPAFFHPEDKTVKDKLLTQFSTTQRPVIAILMQCYLLEEKIKKGEDGLRLMWIECPIDKKTRDLLIDLQKKHDITIVVGVTGDYTFEGLEHGQFLIENGQLLNKLTS